MFFKLRGWIMLRARSDAAKEIEILVPPRHQLAVLPSRTPPPQMDWTHRPLIAASPDCYRYVDATACSSHPKIPRWHRQLVARQWTATPPAPGRPAIPACASLVVRLATENSTSAGLGPLAG
jgi:putative transposase